MTSSHFIVSIPDCRKAPGLFDDGNAKLPAVEAYGNFMLQSSAPVIPLGHNGVIIGHLFSRSELGRRVIRLSQEEQQTILANSGKSLLNDFWGGYVAIVAEDSGKVTVIRDPSGIMPCYWRRQNGRYIVSNDIETIACWGGTSRVHLPSILSYLASFGYSGDRTGLIDVLELPAGHALVSHGISFSIQSIWTPWDHVFPVQKITSAEAAEQLEYVTRTCVGAWASCFDNIILGISGGLDSSIVGMLSAPNTLLRCLNMYTDSPDGDERVYAQVLADALGLPLELGHFQLEDIDVLQATLPHRPWPNISPFVSSILAVHRKMNNSHEASAFFSGNGGDSIFCSLRSTSPFLDRLLSDGPGAGLKRSLEDLCALTESDAGTVIKTAWRQYLKTRKPPTAKLDLVGLAKEHAPSSPLLHPWVVEPPKALPGKMAHVGMLARAQQSHELYARSCHAPHIAPLLSQPIVELCLSIPTWLWIEGGVNRAVARTAFRNYLPERLIGRKSKGGPGTFVQDIYRANAGTIKSMLREGLLSQSGFLDQHYLDAQDDFSWRGNSRVQRLLHLAGAENWCRYWEGRHNGVS